MKEKEFDALVKIVEKKLFKEEYPSVHYLLRVNGYNDEDIELIVCKAIKNLIDCSPNMNALVCIVAEFLLKMKNCIGDDIFSGLNLNHVWEAAKLLFYGKAKTSTQALILSRKEKG